VRSLTEALGGCFAASDHVRMCQSGALAKAGLLPPSTFARQPPEEGARCRALPLDGSISCAPSLLAGAVGCAEGLKLHSWQGCESPSVESWGCCLGVEGLSWRSFLHPTFQPPAFISDVCQKPSQEKQLPHA